MQSSLLQFHLFVYRILQVKLFREWSSKWPADQKLKLKEKVCEIDASFVDKLKEEITNGFTNGNGVASGQSSPTEPQPPILIQNEAIVA